MLYSGDDFYGDEITSPLYRPNTINPLAREDEQPRPLPKASNDPAAEYFIPTAEWIMNLKVGDLVPDCFGGQAEIVEITARRLDIRRKMFICLYIKLSETSRMSGSFKAGELHRSLRITGRHTSTELDLIEKKGA